MGNAGVCLEIEIAKEEERVVMPVSYFACLIGWSVEGLIACEISFVVVMTMMKMMVMMVMMIMMAGTSLRVCHFDRSCAISAELLRCCMGMVTDLWTMVRVD